MNKNSYIRIPRIIISVWVLTFLIGACTSLNPKPIITQLPTTSPHPIRTLQPTATDTLEPTVTFMPTTTPTSTVSPSPTATPTVTQTPIHPAGSIVIHEPDEEIIYKWFSYVPRGLSKAEQVYILITGLNGGLYDYEESARTAEMMLRDRLNWPHINQFILLVPVIPRRESPHVYPVAFDLNSFRETNVFYNRADLKVNLMIDRLITDLRLDGYRVSTRVMIEGYSSGGMFAQRYALLHPERVEALAGGQCGGNFTLPLFMYDNTTLNWPVGVNNLENLADITFNLAAYKEIDQYIYIGDRDTGEGGTTIVWNRLHPTWGAQYMWESVWQMEFLNINFGETDPIRLQNQIGYLNQDGFENIEFRLYPGAQHEITGEMISDFMRFLADHQE